MRVAVRGTATAKATTRFVRRVVATLYRLRRTTATHERECGTPEQKRALLSLLTRQ